LRSLPLAILSRENQRLDLRLCLGQHLPPASCILTPDSCILTW
jgi:hypothetical protein